jgi:hypothetical protein
MHSPLATAHHRIIGCYRAIFVHRAGDGVVVSIETHRNPVTASLGVGETLLTADALERDAFLTYNLGDGRVLAIEPHPDTGFRKIGTCDLKHAHTSVKITAYGTVSAMVQLCSAARDQLVMALREAAE